MVKRGMDSQRTCDGRLSVQERKNEQYHSRQGQGCFFTSSRANRQGQDIHSKDPKPQTTDKPSSITENTMNLKELENKIIELENKIETHHKSGDYYSAKVLELEQREWELKKAFIKLTANQTILTLTSYARR